MIETPPQTDAKPEAARKRGPWVGWALKLAVGIAIVVYLTTRIDLGALWLNLVATDPLLFVVSFVLSLASFALMSKASVVALEPQPINVSVRRMFDITMIVQFYSLFMPGVSASIVKWHKLAATDGRRAEAAAFIAFFRLLHAFTLALLCLVAVVADGSVGSRSVRDFSLVAIVLLALPGIALFSRRFHALVENVAIKRLGDRASVVKKLWGALKAFAVLSPKRILVMTVFALAGHVVDILGLVALAAAADIEVGLMTLAWIHGVVVLAALLPFSVAGLGIREASLIALLAHRGIGEPAVLAFSLLILALSVLRGLFGGVLEARETLFS